MMQVCLTKWNTELVELTEIEFMEFMDHAEKCQHHRMMLEQYESEILPLIKLAFDDVTVDSFKSEPNYNQQLVERSFFQHIIELKEYALLLICNLENYFKSVFCLNRVSKFIYPLLISSFFIGVLTVICLLNNTINSNTTIDLAGKSEKSPVTEKQNYCPKNSACLETLSMTQVNADQLLSRFNGGMYKGNITY